MLRAERQNLSIFDLAVSVKYQTYFYHNIHSTGTGLRSAVCNKSEICRSRGRKIDPVQVPYFHWDWPWNNFYGHSPPSADSRRVFVSYKQKYVHKELINCLVKLAQYKNVARWTNLPYVTIAVDWDVKHQTE